MGRWSTPTGNPPSEHSAATGRHAARLSRHWRTSRQWDPGGFLAVVGWSDEKGDRHRNQ